MWCILTIEHYSPVKRRKLLIHITTWMNLKKIMVNEKSQFPKLHSLWFHLYDITEMTKIQKWWTGQQLPSVVGGAVIDLLSQLSLGKEKDKTFLSLSLSLCSCGCIASNRAINGYINCWIVLTCHFLGWVLWGENIYTFYTHICLCMNLYIFHIWVHIQCIHQVSY